MIIQFGGFLGSGKNTAARVLVEEFGFVEDSFAKPLKAIALAANPFIPCDDEVTACTFSGISHFTRLAELVEARGWEAAKKIPEVRGFLQRLGTEGVRDNLGEHIWASALRNRHENRRSMGQIDTAVTDTRFPNEIFDSLDSKFLWVHRPGKGPTGHSSETDISSLADGIIFNTGTIEDMLYQVRFYAEMWGCERSD